MAGQPGQRTFNVFVNFALVLNHTDVVALAGGTVPAAAAFSAHPHFLSVCLSVSLFLSVFLSVSVCRCMSVSVYLSVSRSLGRCLCLSVSLSLSLALYLRRPRHTCSRSVL